MWRCDSYEIKFNILEQLETIKHNNHTIVLLNEQRNLKNWLLLQNAAISHASDEDL